MAGVGSGASASDIFPVLARWPKTARATTPPRASAGAGETDHAAAELPVDAAARASRRPRPNWRGWKTAARTRFQEGKFAKTIARPWRRWGSSRQYSSRPWRRRTAANGRCHCPPHPQLGNPSSFQQSVAKTRRLDGPRRPRRAPRPSPRSKTPRPENFILPRFRERASRCPRPWAEAEGPKGKTGEDVNL